jgi:PadR family transcriptional regulator, regulatory protein PadR
MYICPMYSSELLKGTLKTIVLNLLKEKGKMYGYEITQNVKERTKGKIQITEGALYPTLHALEKNGEVRTETEYIGKRVRKYYILTDQGTAAAAQKVNEFSDFVETMKFLLNLEPSVGNA